MINCRELCSCPCTVGSCSNLTNKEGGAVLSCCFGCPAAGGSISCVPSSLIYAVDTQPTTDASTLTLLCPDPFVVSLTLRKRLPFISSPITSPFVCPGQRYYRGSLTVGCFPGFSGLCSPYVNQSKHIPSIVVLSNRIRFLSHAVLRFALHMVQATGGV